MAEKNAQEHESTLGLTVSKNEDINEWYSQIVTKSDLADYSSVSGCIIFKPYSYAIWERIQAQFDMRIKQSGHQNCYFPMFIPEKLLTKESEHVEGFSPEVAWVTHAGDTKLNEKLAVRPTSETIMYESFGKWIRSWRDLPLLLNQWNSVVRWEFKHAKPFLRTREFLWQEGHTAHATKEDAEKEVMQQLFEYSDLIENHMAIPVINGKKTEKEKFAGADYTTTCEALMPDGKALQVATSHMLGQNFAKPFNITFVDKDEKEKHVWQTSWGLSTRTIGAMILAHGDDKGLVLPPRLAPVQIAVVPIVFSKSTVDVIGEAKKIMEKIPDDVRVEFDERDMTPGRKFNYWELKGVPLRIEIGPKDVEKEQITLVKRHTGEKVHMPYKEIERSMPKVLDDIQREMLERARERMKENIVEPKTFDEMKQAIKDKKMVMIPFCGETDAEEKVKEECDGATSRCIPFKQEKTDRKCVVTGKDAKHFIYFAKAY